MRIKAVLFTFGIAALCCLVICAGKTQGQESVKKDSVAYYENLLKANQEDPKTLVPKLEGAIIEEIKAKHRQVTFAIKEIQPLDGEKNGHLTLGKKGSFLLSGEKFDGDAPLGTWHNMTNIVTPMVPIDFRGDLRCPIGSNSIIRIMGDVSLYLMENGVLLAVPPLNVDEIETKYDITGDLLAFAILKDVGMVYLHGKGIVKWDGLEVSLPFSAKPQKQSVETASRDAEAYNYYIKSGNAYAKKGKYDRAIADYEKAIELDPESADAYYSRGSAYSGKDEYDRAIADYTKVIELDPKSADAYYHRGNAYSRKGEYDPAISDFNRAIEETNPTTELKIGCISKVINNPMFAEANNNLAIAYYYKGEYNKAREVVHKMQGQNLQVSPKLIELLRQASER